MVLSTLWKADKTMYGDGAGAGPISNLVYKHNLKAAWFGGGTQSKPLLIARSSQSHPI